MLLLTIVRRWRLSCWFAGRSLVTCNRSCRHFTIVFRTVVLTWLWLISFCTDWYATQSAVSSRTRRPEMPCGTSVCNLHHVFCVLCPSSSERQLVFLLACWLRRTCHRSLALLHFHTAHASSKYDLAVQNGVICETLFFQV